MLAFVAWITLAGKPEMLAPGVVSTKMDEFGGALTPDGHEFYFSISVPRFFLEAICVSTKRNGRWTTPKIAPWSGLHHDFDPCLSPDGKKLFFISDRPVHTEKKSDYDVWMLTRLGGRWSNPIHLPAPVNSDGNEHFASCAANGDLYVCSDRDQRSNKVYRIPFVESRYGKAEALSAAINGEGNTLESSISPDGRTLVSAIIGRRDSLGLYDIYISHKRGHDWTPIRNLGRPINSSARDYSPRISTDGQWLYFSSETGFADPKNESRLSYRQLVKGCGSLLNGFGNIYRVRLPEVSDETQRSLHFMPRNSSLDHPEDLSRSSEARRPWTHAPGDADYASPPTPSRLATKSGGVAGLVERPARQRAGLVPRMLAPGVISTPRETVSATEGPDGTVVFVVSCQGTLQTKTVLCETRKRNGRWHPPAVLPFSGVDTDFNPQFTPDGSHLLFVSNRGDKRHFQVWSVVRQDARWGKPGLLSAPVNENGHQLCAAQAANGDLFVTSTRSGAGALYQIKSHVAKPVEAVNKVGFVNDVCVAPDQSYLIFSCFGAKDEFLMPGAIYQRGDLYVSFKKDGVWQTPSHLQAPINTPAADVCPTLSPDGKTLYFASDRGFLSKPRTRTVTYEEIRRNIVTLHNGLSKVFQIPVSELLAAARKAPPAD